MSQLTARAVILMLVVASAAPALAGDKKKDKAKERHEKRMEVMETVLRTLAESAVAPTAVPRGGASQGTVQIQRIWVVHNQWVSGRQGMIIHSQVGVWGRRGIPTRIAAYFHYGDGRVLKDFDGAYAAADGQVSVGSEAETPRFDETSFNDWQLFLPYDELHMARGNYDLMFNVWVVDHATGAGLASLTNQHFTYWKN